MKGTIIRAKWDGFNLEKWAVKYENNYDVPFLLVSHRNLDDNYNLKYGFKEGDEVEFRIESARMNPHGCEAFIVYPIEEQAKWDEVEKNIKQKIEELGMSYENITLNDFIDISKGIYIPPTKKD